MLEVKDLTTYYGRIPALKKVSLEVFRGEMVVIIGANGAGKSTLIRSIMGLLPAKSKRGTILFKNKDVKNLEAEDLVPLGMSVVFERRELFTNMTVKENLELGAYHRDRKALKKEISGDLDAVYNLFPILEKRGKQLAGTLSGGEQQMLAIGRALMSRPQMLLLDEPSMGLAPIVVQEIMETIKRLRRDGLTLLMVEQNTVTALNTGDRGYVLQNGEILLEDSTQNLLNNKEVQNLYLGGAD